MTHFLITLRKHLADYRHLANGSQRTAAKRQLESLLVGKAEEIAALVEAVERYRSVRNEIDAIDLDDAKSLVGALERSQAAEQQLFAALARLER